MQSVPVAWTNAAPRDCLLSYICAFTRPRIWAPGLVVLTQIAGKSPWTAPESFASKTSEEMEEGRILWREKWQLRLGFSHQGDALSP